MHVKARPCLEALKLGFNVVYTDTDIVWLRNPLRELRRPGASNSTGHQSADVLIQSDYDESNEVACQAHHQCPRSY